MAKRKGSRGWWTDQLRGLYRRQPETTLRQFAEAIGVPFGQLHYRLYDPAWERQREVARRSLESAETRLVAVDVAGVDPVAEVTDRAEIP